MQMCLQRPCRTGGVLILVLGLVCFFLAGQPSTQAAGFAAIEGVVKSPDGQPVPATIHLRGDELDLQATSQPDGSFEIAAIPLNTDYTLVDITIEASGYGTYNLHNVVLYPNQTLLLNTVSLNTTEQKLDAGGLPTTLEAPPPQVYQTFPSSSVQGDMVRPQVSHDTLPTTIRVAYTGYASCGYWSNGSYILYPILRVDTLDFKEYVKGVLPHEWVASWNGASLRAGAVAVKMYGWFKINIGPRGYWNGQAYDVRGDTCDQVYTSFTYASTNAAVDDTWNTIMRRNNLVVEIHYVDGNQATCNGTFPGTPCMEQWGSKALGDAGWDWLSILRYYYNTLTITDSFITGNYTTPLNGATVGNSAYLAGTASAGLGVRQVQFTARWSGSWRLLGTDTSAPYEFHWDLCAFAVPNGSVELGFDVMDNNGNIAYSPQGTRTITVNADCTQPRGGLTAPLNGTTVTQAVTLAAWAAANTGVQEVRFIASWAGKSPFRVYTDSVAPYAFGWNLCTSDVPDGVITLGIEILDRSGQVADSPTGTRTITKAFACPRTAAPARNTWDIRTPTVTWLRVSWAVRYEFQLAGNTQFNSLVDHDETIPADTLSRVIPVELDNGTYYWRLRACSATACGPWSVPESLVVYLP